MNFLFETLRLGMANLMLHKLRSFLTVLGIIFGVAAVITMVAIGEGNKRKALAQIEQLGARNIIVRSVKPPAPASMGTSSSMLTYGIKRLDLRRIEQTVGAIERIVPLKQVGARVSRGAHQVSASAFGTTPDLLLVTSLHLDRGRYLTREDQDRLSNVAVIGAEVAARLFPLTDPLGAELRIDRQAFTVIGVLRPVGLAGGAGTALVGRDLNFDIHIPLATARARFGDTSVRRSSGSVEATLVELTELYIEVADQNNVPAVADQVTRILDAEHAKSGDVTTVVPLELLEQAERTQRMFNLLMIAIASISLLVGGIGIMNIMLASVTERTREIGIRRALGATRKHIIAQFLVETTVLSGIGGALGVVIGWGGSAGVGGLQHILPGMFSEMGTPHTPPWAIIVSFTVAVTVGIAFGLYPAMQAARQDPIVALRHD
ncbi:MAG: ABC transporter permease [Phycisphaeraceae bacterium]